jgi:hypothetical protein
MSKGSKPRITDRKSFNKNFDTIKTTGKVEGFTLKKGKLTKTYK